MIFVIDDDVIMAKCVARVCEKCDFEVRIFGDAITAINAFSDGLPEMIFLDILLSGPDGFTFLNELVSYSDTVKIPVVVISSLQFPEKDLLDYGIVGVLDKTKMTPEEIQNYVRRYAGR